jgi:hypothetical protein
MHVAAHVTYRVELTDSSAPSSAVWLGLAGVLIGALIAGLFSWLASRKQINSDQRIASARVVQDRQVAMTERATAFLAATYGAFASLRDLAVAPISEKRALDKREVWPSAYAMTKALVAIRINDSPELSQAADKFDLALRTLGTRARVSEFTHDDWTRERDSELAGLSQQFQDVAREKIRSVRATDL